MTRVHHPWATRGKKKRKEKQRYRKEKEKEKKRKRKDDALILAQAVLQKAYKRKESITNKTSCLCSRRHTNGLSAVFQLSFAVFQIVKLFAMSLMHWVFSILFL
jgi:hypothetical protein